MILKITVLSLYIIMIIFFGLKAMKKTNSFKDFFLGGGDIGPWLTAFTYGTAYFSAVLFIGFAGKIGWVFGYSGILIALCNSLVGVLLVWWLLGFKIKKMSSELQVSTMGEFFEKRYDSKFLKLMASISIFIFFIPYTAAVFMGLTYLFESTFNVNYIVALVGMGIFTAFYMVLGGYKAMTMVDVLFGIIMVIGVLILVGFTINYGGGLNSITEKLSSIDPLLVSPVGPPGIWPLFCLIFLTSVAPFGMPQLVQKFYAIKDKRSVHIGMIASTLFCLLVGSIAYFIGSTTRIFLNPEIAPKAFSNGRPVFDALMPELLMRVMPNSLSILLLLVILSASMSTLAALVLISSSSVAKDIYQGFINKDVTDKKLILLMRLSSVFFVFLSVVLAYFRPKGIVSILGISWGAIGSVFLGPFVFGLFSKKVNSFGAISSSVLGLLTCIGLYINGSSSPEAGTIGMIVSLIVNPIFSFIYSLCTPTKRR